MTRTMILVILTITGLGCHAPMPKFDDLSPYGNTRVPPPGTGSYGSANMYYQPTGKAAAPGAANASLDAAPSPASIQSSPTANPKWRPVQLEPTVMTTQKNAVGTGVAQPGNPPVVAPASHQVPVNIPAAAAARSDSSHDRPEGARALHVNDLTGGAPRKLQPAPHAQPIPPAVQPVAPTTPVTSPPPSGVTTTADGLKWRSR